MKRIFYILPPLALLLLSVWAAGSCSPGPTSEKEKAMHQFVSKLMGQMTLDEKIGQLNLPVTGTIVTGQAQSSDVAKRIRAGQVGGLFNLKGVASIREMQRLAVEESRLHIPLLFGMDVIHGYESVFPIPLALSCTWDMDAIEQSARIAATEASADGICWTFSPMVDICHDPRWGRIAEGSGEDPFLGAAIARAMVHGYQGDLSRNDQIMACVKHYALYGAPEAGRDYNTVDMSWQSMYNTYFPPYKAAVEAGVGSVMASFNEVDGVPATGNQWLLTDVLREEWGFRGFVVTDYTGITEMTAHGMGDSLQVAALAMNAGVDMDMVSEAFLTQLKTALKKKMVTPNQIDNACRRILEAKYKLGLFDNPYKYCDAERAKTQIFTPEHLAACRRTAAESFVLLKNEKDLLPLAKRGTIAVVGPLGNTHTNMPGTWSVAGKLQQAPTLVEGLQEVVGDQAKILYAKGSNLMSDSTYEARATTFGRSLHRDKRTDEALLQEALSTATRADVIVAALGESSEMSGESSSRACLDMPDTQHALLQALLGTGKPVVLVHFAGRPTVLTWEEAHVPAILNVWFGGIEAGPAIADVLFGDVNPSGKLTTTFPKCVGQIPLFYNHKNTGRPLAEGQWFTKFRSEYLDVDNDPLYPFGYGLSYTTYQYSPITLSQSTINPTDSLTATVTVTNTGKRDGTEVVQMYIRDLVGSVTRPVKELKGFQRVALKAGESKQVSFSIGVDLLKFYNYRLDYVYEPGDFQVMIGPNSRDVQTAGFKLMETEE